MTQILSKYQGEKHPAQIILLGQEAWAGVSVATGFDTGEGAGDVQPRQQQHRHTARGYGCRTGHMDAGIGRSLYRPHEYTGIESGFINQYNIEDNDSDDQGVLSEDGTHRFYFGQYLRWRHHAGTGAERNEEVSRNRPDPDGRPEAYYLYNCRRVASFAGEYGNHGRHVACGYERRLFHAECYLCHDGGYSDIPTFTPSSVSLGYWAIGGVLPDYRKLGMDMALASVQIDQYPADEQQHLSVIGSKAVLDSRKVKEWGLDPDILPFDVQIINQTVSFYQQYTYQIWSALCFVS